MNTRLHATRQRGLALAVVLILLLVMTLLGLASMRGTLLQERMSASLTDRSRSFQAAEAALRQGEVNAGFITNSNPAPAGVFDCRTVNCLQLPPELPPTPVPVPPVANWAAAQTPALPVFTNTAPPQFLLELLAINVAPTPEERTQLCPMAVDINAPECSARWRVYRITARSQQAGRAGVMLQSIFKVR